MKKFFVFVIILFILGGLGWQIYQKLSTSKKSGRTKRSAVAVPVEIASVQQKVVSDLRIFTGTLSPDSQFIVAPKISGRLEKLMVNIGDEIKQSQVIAMLDDEEYQQQVKQAVAQLNVALSNVEEAVSNLEVAKSELARLQPLHQRSIVSKAELDVAEAKYKAAEVQQKVTEAQVSQKRAELKAAEVRLSYAKIVASWQDGGQTRLIGERFVYEGAMLMANTPIVSILDINKVLAVIYVIERDYPRIKLGQNASITTDAFPGEVFTGKIVRIAPFLKEASRQGRVEIEIPNPHYLLKPGMFIRVQIEFEKHENATVIPLAALAKRNGKEGVFQVDLQTMKATFVPITIGIQQDEWLEVLKTPISGYVVTMGHHLLEDGSLVTIPEKKENEASSKANDSKKKEGDRKERGNKKEKGEKKEESDRKEGGDKS